MFPRLKSYLDQANRRRKARQALDKLRQDPHLARDVGLDAAPRQPLHDWRTRW